MFRLHATIFQVCGVQLPACPVFVDGIIGFGCLQHVGLPEHPHLVVVMALRPPTAVACLPATHVAQGYRDWCQHVDLPERIKELGLEELRKSGEVVVRRRAAGCGLRAAVGCAGCWVVVLCRAGLRCRPAFCSVCFKHVRAALVGSAAAVLLLPGRHAPADARRPLTARLRCTCPAPLPCPQEWEFLLEELALYFLMYSEGANLRHTAEARGEGTGL